MKNGHLIQTANQPDLYTGPTHPDHIQLMDMKPAYVDIVAIAVDKGDQGNSHLGHGSVIRMSILNRHPTADWKADVSVHDMGKPDVCYLVGIVVGGSADMQTSARSRSPRWHRTTCMQRYVAVPTLFICELRWKYLTGQNTFEHPTQVVPKVHKIAGDQWQGSYTVRKHSWTFFEFRS